MAQLFDDEQLSLELSIKVAGSAEVEKADASVKRLSADMGEATKRSQATVDSFKLLNQQAADLTRNATSASTAIASVRAVSQGPGSRVDLDNERRFLEQVQRVNRSAVVGLTQESRPQAPPQQVLAQAQLPPPQSAAPPTQPPVERHGLAAAFAPIALATPEQSRALELEQQKTDRLAQSRARLMLLEARTTDAQAHPASLTIAGGKEPPHIVGLDRVLQDLDGALVNRVANIVKGFGNPKVAGQFLGSGAEAAVFDIGRGRVLKVRPEFDEQEAAKRQGRMRQVEAALGPFGNRAIAQETYSNEAGALSLEVFKKMRPHEAGVDAGERIARDIYKKTGVLTDFYGSGNYGQARVGGRLKVIDSGFGIVAATEEQAKEHFDPPKIARSANVALQRWLGAEFDTSERVRLREEWGPKTPAFDELKKRQLADPRMPRSSELGRMLSNLAGLIPPEPDRHRPATQQESDWAHLQLPIHRTGEGVAYAVPQPARERPVPVREPKSQDLSAMSAGGSIWSSTYEPPVPSPPKVDLHPAFRPSRMGLATQEEVEAAFQKMAPEAATYYKEKGWEEPHGFLEGTQKSIAAGGISREVLGNLVNSGVHIGLRRPEDVYGPKTKNWLGAYDRKTKEINVDPQRGSVRVMLHEVGHAVEDATRFSGNLDTPSNFGIHINPKAYSTPQLEQERFAETFANRYHPGDSAHNTSRGAAEMRALTIGSGFFNEDDLFSRQRERLVQASAWSKRVGGTPTPFGEQVKKEETEERFAFSQLYKDFARMGEWEKAFKSAEREAQQRLSIESPGHPLSSAGRGLSGMVPPKDDQIDPQTKTGKPPLTQQGLQYSLLKELIPEARSAFAGDDVLRELGNATPKQQDQLWHQIYTAVQKHGSVFEPPKLLGQGAERAVFDIGRGNVLKLGVSEDPEEEIERRSRVEAALGGYGNATKLAQYTQVGKQAILSEISPKLTPFEPEHPPNLGKTIWDRTHVVVDVSSLNFGKDAKGNIRVLDPGGAHIVPDPSDARELLAQQEEIFRSPGSLNRDLSGMVPPPKAADLSGMVPPQFEVFAGGNDAKPPVDFAARIKRVVDSHVDAYKRSLGGPIAGILSGLPPRKSEVSDEEGELVLSKIHQLLGHLRTGGIPDYSKESANPGDAVQGKPPIEEARFTHPELMERVGAIASRKLSEVRNSMGDTVEKLARGVPKPGSPISAGLGNVLLTRLYEITDQLEDKGVIPTKRSDLSGMVPPKTQRDPKTGRFLSAEEVYSRELHEAADEAAQTPEPEPRPITKEIRAEAERNIRTIQAQRRASAAQVRSVLGSLPGREGIFGTVDIKGSESDYAGSAGAPHVEHQATTTGTIKLPPEVRQQVSEEVRRALGSVHRSQFVPGPGGFSASAGQGAGSMPFSFSGTGSGAPPQPPPPPRPGFFSRVFGGGGAQQPPNQPPFNPRAPAPPPGGIFNQPPQGPPVPPGAAGGGGGLFGSSQGAYGGMGYGTIALLAYGAALRSLTVNMVEYAARTQTMELVTRQMARANGLNTESVLAEVRAVQSYNITTQASHAVVQRMMMAQLDVAKAPQLAQVAQNISAVAGIPAPEAMERMVVGITSGYTRVLHQMGLQVSQVQSLRQLTAERHAEGLQGPPSEYEKRQALLNDVIIAGASAMGTYEKSLLTAGGQFTLLSRDAQETANVIGHEFLPTYGRFVSTLDNGLMAIQQHGSQAHTVLTGLLGLFTGLAASGGIALLRGLVARVGVGAALGGPAGLAVGAATAIGAYMALNQDPVAAQVKTSQEVQERMRKRSEDLQKERSQLLAMPDHSGQEWRTSWDANTEALRSMAESQADVQHNLTEQLAAEYNKRLKDFDGYAKGMEGRQKGDALPTEKTAGSLLGWALHMVNPLASTGRTAFGRRLAERDASQAEVPTAPGSPEGAVKKEAEAQRKEEARVGLLSPDLVNKDRQATQRILSEMIYAGGKIAKIDEAYAEGGSKFKKAGEAFLSPRQKIQYDAREEIAETERLVKTVRDIQDKAAAGDPAARHRISEINKYYGSPQAVERFLASTGSVARQVREDEATSLSGLNRQTAAHIAQIREQVDLERVRAAVVRGSHQSEAQAVEAEFRVRQDTARRVLHISGDSDSYRKSVAQAQADHDSSVIRLAQQERDEQERRREAGAKDAGQFYRERALQAPTTDYRSVLMEGFNREMAATKAVTNEKQQTNEQVAITIKLRDDLVKLTLEEGRAAAEGQVQRLRADVAVQDQVDQAINRRRRRGRNLDERDPYGEIQRTEERGVRLAQQEYELLQPTTPAPGQRALTEQRDTEIYAVRARARGEVVKQRAEDETVARTGQVEALELTSRGQQRVNEMRAFGYAEEQAAAYNNFNLQMGFIQAEQDLRGRGLESEKATRKEVMQAEFELLEKEMETRRRTLEEQREFAGGLFDALTSHGQIPVRQFLMDQLKGIDRTIFQNAFKEIAGGAWKSLGNIFPGQETTDAQGRRTPTFIGRLLSGTPLGVTHTEDIARLQADVTSKNTDAEVELTRAVQSLDEAIRGATGEQLGAGGTSVPAVPGSAGLGVLGTVGRVVQQLAQPTTAAAAAVAVVPAQPTSPIGSVQEGQQTTAARGGTAPPGTAQGTPGDLTNLSGMPSMRLGPTDVLAQGGVPATAADARPSGTPAAPNGPVSPDVGVGTYGNGALAPSDASAPISDFDASWKAAVAGEAKAFPQLPGKQSIFQQLAGATVGGSFIGSSFLMGRGSNDPSSQPSFSSHTPGHTVGGVSAPHGGGGMLGDVLSIGMIAGSMGLSQWANRRAKTPQFSPKLGALMGLELPAVKSLEGAGDGGEGVGAELAMQPTMPPTAIEDFARLAPDSGAATPVAANPPAPSDSADPASLDFAVASLPRSDVLADTFAQPDQGTSSDSTSLFNFGPKTNIFSDSMPQDQQVADVSDPFAHPLPQDQLVSAPAIKELAAGLQGPTGTAMPDRAPGGFTVAFAQQALNTAAGIASMFKPKDGGGGGQGDGGGSYDNRPLDTSGGSDSGGSGSSDTVGSDSTDSNGGDGDGGGVGGALKGGLTPKGIAQEFAGVVQAIHGFSQGGARGDIAGVGGALTAIAPFTGPVAPFLMAGGMVANLVSGLFPDPKLQRQHDITTWMNQNKYVPPVTMENMDQSASGGVVDYGLGGRARDSGVGMFPLNVVQNQYRLGEEKNSGMFQSTHSYDPYTYLPGSANINPGNRAGPQVTLSMPVSVSTMDSRSFLDNSGMITDAVNKELLAGNGISQTMTNAIFGMG